MPPAYHKLIVTQEQLSTIVGFMERHGDLSMHPRVTKVKHLWSELGGILNQIGVGPRKTVDQWKKTWTDIKYRAKEKALKLHEASNSGGRYMIELTDIEKRICRVLEKRNSDQEYLEDTKTEFEEIEEHDPYENDESADPVFIEFIEHTESLSPIQETENSPPASPIPPTEKKRKRKRRDSTDRKMINSPHKRQNTSLTNNLQTKNNLEEESQLHHYHLLELKRLELETLREANFHEREKIRAEIDRDSLKVQQQLITFLEDIKPALLKFLNK